MPTEDPIVQIPHDLVDEVICTAIALDDVLTSLLEQLDADAFGGGKTEVPLGMTIGSIVPAKRAAGKDSFRAATALVAATREREMRTSSPPPRRRQSAKNGNGESCEGRLRAPRHPFGGSSSVAETDRHDLAFRGATGVARDSTRHAIRRRCE